MQPVDFFMMSGQSNMQGQSEGPPEPPPKLLDGVSAWEYHHLSGTLIPVAHPSGEDIIRNGEALLLGAHQGFGGLLPDFASAYAHASGHNACYAHCAKGATTMAEWQKGTARFACAVEKALGALKLLEKEEYSVQNACLVWLQGESDGIINTGKDEYARLLLRFWQDLKKEVPLKKFLIIRVGYFHHFPCEPIMQAQEKLCQTQPDFHMISRLASTFTVENGLMQGETAPYHYTNRGYAVIGADAGKNAALLLKN